MQPEAMEDPPPGAGIIHLALLLLYRSRTARITALSYLISTLLWVLVGVVPTLSEPLLRKDFLWVFGPPIILLHGAPAWWLYFLGSLFCGGLLLAASFARPRFLRLPAAALAVILWCVFGWLVYAPMV